MKFEYSRRFTSQYEKSPYKIQIAFQKRLKLFLKYENHPLLNKHYLKGEFKGCFSVNVTGDWRAILRKDKDKNFLLFVAIGTHSELYG